MIPVSSESGPKVTAGSMAMTIRCNDCGADLDAQFLDPLGVPERAGRVGQQLRVEFLSSQSRAGVLADNRLKERRCKVVTVRIA